MFSHFMINNEWISRGIWRVGLVVPGLLVLMAGLDWLIFVRWEQQPT